MNTSLLKNYSIWFFLWIILVASYVASMRFNFYVKEWDSVVYVFQFVADISIGIFSYLSYKNKIDRIAKRFYWFIAVSLVPGLFANEVYNVLINFFHIKKITPAVSIVWVVSYTLFLLIQITGWLYLLIKNAETRSVKKNWMFVFPYLQASLIVLFSLGSIVILRHSVLKEIGLPGSINSILEVFLFILISLSFSKTKNKSLVYLEMVFLLLIAFNLAHRFSYTSGHYFKAFDVVWLISLVTIIFGLIGSSKEKNERIGFFSINSLHVYSGAIFMTFSTFLLILFIMIDFVITSIELNSISNINFLLQNIPSILIFSYAISLLISKTVANYISKPLESISKRVDLAYENKETGSILKNEFSIYEINKLDKFILKIINQLKVANQAKSDFLMNMSHDFRTPASGICSLAKSIYKKMSDDDLKASQKLIVDSSEQLNKFLDDILDYSRLDSGTYFSKNEKIDIVELVNSVVGLIAAKAQEKSLDVRVELENTELDYEGDRSLIHSILLNVISNAVKFTLKGYILVSAYRAYGSQVIIKVKDSGVGIAKEHFEMIFQPFNRIKSSEVAQSPGIGLGLSNVRLKLHKIGGSISLSSEVGKGTIFTICLP